MASRLDHLFHAWAYEAVRGWLDLRGFAAVRRSLLSGLQGRILEIGAGTGANVRHAGGSVTELVLLEPEPAVAARLRRRAATAGVPCRVVAARAEDLPFPDRAFDAVVATLVLCSVRDPAGAVAEIRRVLRPGGTFAFAEHVRSDDPRCAARQERWAPAWSRMAGGCRPDRDTVATIGDGGFTVTALERGRLRGAPGIVRPLAVGRATAPPAPDDA